MWKVWCIFLVYKFFKQTFITLIKQEKIKLMLFWKQSPYTQFCSHQSRTDSQDVKILTKILGIALEDRLKFFENKQEQLKKYEKSQETNSKSRPEDELNKKIEEQCQIRVVQEKKNQIIKDISFNKKQNIIDNYEKQDLEQHQISLKNNIYTKIKQIQKKTKLKPIDVLSKIEQVKIKQIQYHFHSTVANFEMQWARIPKIGTLTQRQVLRRKNRILKRNIQNWNNAQSTGRRNK